jgi:hypothetical protein
VCFDDNRAARAGRARVAGIGSQDRLPDQENAMENSHVAALQAKHEGLERRLREEMSRPAPDDVIVHSIKKQKLLIKEEIAGI